MGRQEGISYQAQGGERRGGVSEHDTVSEKENGREEFSKSRYFTRERRRKRNIFGSRSEVRKKAAKGEGESQGPDERVFQFGGKKN